MKRCSRCGCMGMVLIRDSVAMRRETLYRMLWYRCPECGDVGFSRQPAHEASEAESAPDVVVARTVDVLS